MGTVTIYVNEAQTIKELDIIRKSINKNIPFGGNIWTGKMVDKFKLSQTLRNIGRPKKGGLPHLSWDTETVRESILKKTALFNSK